MAITVEVIQVFCGSAKISFKFVCCVSLLCTYLKLPKRLIIAILRMVRRFDHSVRITTELVYHLSIPKLSKVCSFA